MDKRSRVRLVKIRLANFKNIKAGEIELGKDTKNQADIIGIYGQNGSGKTAVVNAMDILFCILKGEPLPEDSVYYIRSGSSSMTLEFTFEISTSMGDYLVVYTLDAIRNDEGQCDIISEVLKFSYQIDEEKGRMATAISTNTPFIFLPETKMAELLGPIDKQVAIDLLVTKQLMKLQKKSFIFCSSLLAAITANGNASSVKDATLDILTALRVYGQSHLYVVDAKTGARSTINELPLVCSNGNVITLDLTGPFVLGESEYRTVQTTLPSLSTILKEIVPALTIILKTYGRQSTNNGSSGYKVEVMSERKGVVIPFRYESDGIKKIVSVLQLLVICFVDKSSTVVIDELDSGIFEYLLGELLKIIREQGLGQLIFTSHNLRPLEVLDKRSIIFTTTNEEKRFARMKNILATNNLRGCYYRSIMLGSNDNEDEFYERTQDAKIAMAFRKLCMDTTPSP